ncbi:phosphatase PAP2 family protein [Chelativorans sp. Marseille-P2723]|uniref:phosphatase PAP2 family protein n=1 Tax=Chelativorans sp. Marseille-P2723 TaxID=2709133 RepID=UPI00156F9F64|nr:phosphatase PAP2 family protein [Chelativorans sp. Marseille-P2723]
MSSHGNGLSRRLTGLVRGMKSRPQTVTPAVMLAILASGLYAFLAIADEVAEGEIHALDEQIFLAFRDPVDPSLPLGPEWMQEVALEITALGGYPVIILSLAVLTGFLLVTRRYGPALYAGLSVTLGWLVSQFSKAYFARPRPDLVEHLDKVHTASFPSGHAMMSTVVFLTLSALVIRFFDDMRVRIYVVVVALLISFIVGLTRIYLGVHWPSDVAAGWALGGAWASLTWLVSAALQFWRKEGK